MPVDSQQLSLQDLQRQIQDLREELAKFLEDGLRDSQLEIQDKMEAIISQVRDQDSKFTRLPLYILSCKPMERIEIKGLFGGPKEPVVKLFETPNALRDGGFNLAIGGKASTNVRGEYRLFSIAGYQARFVSREGIFGLMVIGTDEFMAWVTGSTPPMVKFNPLVLAELTYEFCRFVKELIVFAKPTPASLIFQLQLFGYDANQLSVALPRAGISVSRIISFFPPSEIGSTDLCLQIEVPAEDTPEKAALQLLDELYIKSGLDTDKVPYANRSTGTLDVGLIESGG